MAGVLREELELDWYVIEKGLNGRTTVHDDTFEGDLKSGRIYLRPCLISHAPLDLVILMLGTNDLKVRLNQFASEAAMGIACLIHGIRELNPGPGGHCPEILVIAPPPMLDNVGGYDTFFGVQPNSRQLAHQFEVMANAALKVDSPKLVCGVAAAKAKVPAKRAALKGKLLNGLITNEATAKAVLGKSISDLIVKGLLSKWFGANSAEPKARRGI